MTLKTGVMMLKIQLCHQNYNKNFNIHKSNQKSYFKLQTFIIIVLYLFYFGKKMQLRNIEKCQTSNSSVCLSNLFVHTV